MSSSYGEKIRLTIFGASHSEAIGVIMEGIPAGKKVDMELLNSFLARRAPGRNDFSTSRKESDIPEFLSGINSNVTTGSPITAIIRNTDTRSGDYTLMKKIPRPGHADYTAEIKYKGNQDVRGGGHFSGRMTAPLCIAGGICKQILSETGIGVMARIVSVGDICDNSIFEISVGDKEFPVVDDDIGKKMREYISEIKKEGDSIGGIIECCVSGLPAGLGDPMFGGMENRISSVVFGIPAVKGIEFGLGFKSSQMRGSENNDEFFFDYKTIKTRTNNCGGILGGITNGMPLVFRVAVKPTPSISKQQLSVNMETGENTVLEIKGRHDPCIVPRAVPCIEAAAAIAVYDALLENMI